MRAPAALMLTYAAGCVPAEGGPVGPGWLVGGVVGVLLVLAWIGMTSGTIVRQDPHDHDNAGIEKEPNGGDDPRDTPPPVIYGEEIDASPNKIILLISGEKVQQWVVVNKGWNNNWPDLAVVRKAKADPAWQVLQTINAQANTAVAWQQLVARYSSSMFTDAGWDLLALRVFSGNDINNALDIVKSLNPTAVAVHYVGHGDFDYSFGLGNPLASTTDPYLAIRGVEPRKFRLTDPTGAQRTFGISIPSGQTVVKHYIKDLAPKLIADFPGIPLTLVIDACGNAQALDHRKANLKMVVAVDRLYCGTNLGLFSSIYAGNVVPDCYDNFAASMPGVVATVNATLRQNEVSFVEAKAYRFPHKVTGKPAQEATTTNWKYPWN